MNQTLSPSSARPALLLAVALLLAISQTGLAVAQSFSAGEGLPDGWISKTSNVTRTPEAGVTTEAASAYLAPTSEFDLPLEVVARVRLTEAASRMQVRLLQSDKPLLLAGITNTTALNRVSITAHADGEPMPTNAVSSLTWSRRFNNVGSVVYEWRFPTIANLWDDRDRAEIGASYAALTPFAEKIFVLRLVATNTTRQIWIDDRLVAEHPAPAAGKAQLEIFLNSGAQITSVDIRKPAEHDGFQVLRLDDYQSPGLPRTPGKALALQTGASQVPVTLVGSETPSLDLGSTSYRYRLTMGTGPNAPYVNATNSWPGALTVDPVLFNIRVPYRDYRNAWLVAYLDDDAKSLPKGTLRFNREDAGYSASTDFEITEDAISKGLVRKLDEKTADGKQLYLVRVPLDTNALYGFWDMSTQFLDLQLSKPVHLGRSYPDPIYYGYHAAGLDSSVHVVGITLEEAAFNFKVTPKNYGFLFNAPEKPSYDITVTNRSGNALPATVEVTTTSYDGSEKTLATASTTIPASSSSDVKLTLSDVKLLGWHEAHFKVTAGDETREVKLGLVMLPEGDLPVSNKPNENRFGSWNLWGHYIPLSIDIEGNRKILAMYKQLGIRSTGWHTSFITPEMMKEYAQGPAGPHTVISIYHRLNENDPEAVKKMLEDELALTEHIAPNVESFPYFYGGEWGFDHTYTHAVNPRYTGDGPWQFSDAAMKSLRRQMKIFETIGRMMREKVPNAKLHLQWGSPVNTIPFLEQGFPKDLIDAYGMDTPMFELIPEIPQATIGINQLWTLRQEIDRLGYPQHDINWCEGPFLPTNEGALTLEQQEQHHVRFWLLGLAYGVEQFRAGIVPHDAGNYYGAEHYGAGIFRRIPYEDPKPAVASVAIAMRKLAGYDVVGPVDTGVNTTYCLAFEDDETKAKRYALWRVRGSVETTVNVKGAGSATLTDSMGNSSKLPISDGKIKLTLTPSPVWLDGVESIESFNFAQPVYEAAPSDTTVALAPFSSDNWSYDGSEVESYEHNHHGVGRTEDKQLSVAFSQTVANWPVINKGNDVAAVVTLPAQSAGDRPLAARYGAMVAKQPIEIPGKAKALGVMVDGNSGWGRVVYQLIDAEGERWTSMGTSESWNCDDTHAWSFVNFEGWRYVSFPLPGNHPGDASRDLETTWWKHEGGNGIVELPLKIEKIFVEARNEVLVLGQQKLLQDRDYALTHLTAEYADEWHKSAEAVAHYNWRKPTPQWEGPQNNLIADLRKNANPAPTITGWEEPHQWNDGRRMIIRFDQKEGKRYNVYLSRYPDGRGADVLARNVSDKQVVTGLRPRVTVYLFLTEVDEAGNESKPSAPSELTPVDKFAEK